MRPPVTIIAVLGADAARARRLLERLRSTAGERDEVLAVGDLDVVETAWRGLRAYATRSGDDRAAVVAGLVHASHDAVVWVTDEVELTSRWLEPLVLALDRPDVVAAVPAAADAGSRRLLREQARERWERDRDRVRAAAHADRRCVATTASALGAAGTVDALVAGAGVVVAEGALVSFAAPLLSACLIVRDEEADLPRCLSSLRGLVDEVVVYDTGSTDGTVEVARAAGATVVEGYWDDDFGRARNAALADCRGTWVLHVDADEQFQGDPVSLRAYLADAVDVDKLDLPIDNLDDDGRQIAFTHYAARVFRRERAWWAGRLHEQVVPRPGQDDLVARKTDAVRLLHTGYTADAVAVRDKHARNIRVAEAELASGDGNRALVLANLGRALGAEGRYDDAVDRFAEARDLAVDAVVRRLALRGGAEALLNAGRAGDALPWIDELRACSDRPDMADYLEGVARANLGQLDAAIRLLDGVTEIGDQDGMAYSPQLLDVRRGIVLAGAGRWEEAADALAAVVVAGDVSEPVWAPLAEAFWRSGRDGASIAAHTPADRLVSIAGQLLNAPPVAADAMAEALWGHHHEDVRLVTLAVALAPRLDLERAFVWATRIRAAGAAGRCPLLRIAEDRALPPTERARAAGIAVAAFGDERARTAVTAVARILPEDELGGVLAELSIVAPEVLPDFVAAAAGSGSRALALARLLHGFGAADDAITLLEHVFADGGADARSRAEASDWLVEIGRPEHAAALAGAPVPSA